MAPPSGINHISNPCIYGDLGSTYGERKSRLMKWLSKLFKGGSSSRGVGGGRPPPQLHGEENVIWRAPPRSLDDPSRAREKEEPDRASALSLPRDRRPGPSGYRRQTNNDEEHRWRPNTDDDRAKALQDSLNSPSYPPAPAHYFPWSSYRICSGCHQDIGYGNYLGWMGKYFHPGCFCCHHCRAPITESEFSLSENGGPYHKKCFKELNHPKCEVCLQFIPTNAANLIEYRCHPFWTQKYCPSHEHDNTARCCSCERLESWNARYYSLEDGRSLCFECMESAIMDTGDCQPLYHTIRDYYEGMNMRLDQQIPMLLVERQALNEAIVGEKNGYHHMPETRGLCLSEEQTVASIHKRPKIGGRRLVGMRTQPHKLTRKCEVTAILVLYGLPRLLTGAILAHELMHGWLRLKGYRNLNPEVEEGICQVLSYMWLESEVPLGAEDMPSTSSGASSSTYSSKKGLKSDVENKLGRFFMYQIKHDVSVAYGGGFRAANEAVSKYGLRATLEHIRLTGNFPL